MYVPMRGQAIQTSHRQRELIARINNMSGDELQMYEINIDPIDIYGRLNFDIDDEHGKGNLSTQRKIEQYLANKAFHIPAMCLLRRMFSSLPQWYEPPSLSYWCHVVEEEKITNQ